MAKKKRDQFDRNRILFVMNTIAKERRMARRSGWTAAHTCGSYTLWKDYSFGAKRLSEVSKKIDEMIDKSEKGELDLDAINKWLHDYADLGLEHKEYTTDDITFRKGTFRYFVDERQLMPQNEVNRFATEYAICLLKIMHEEQGFGKDRLNKLYKNLEKTFAMYREDNCEIGKKLVQELRDYAGVYFGSPIDPVTEEVGSIMVGM